ncbi:MAG: glycoside hydrolase family 36 protein [Actinomycetes bacterium]
MPDLSSPDVAVTLHDDGTWSIEWPATGLRVGPLRATVAANGATEPVAGPWHVEGDTARAGGVDGAPTVDLAFDDAVPGGVLATLSATGTGGRVLDRFRIEGPSDLGATTRLVEGYDSWAWAGVRRAEVPGRSFWRSALVGPRGALTVAARTAERFVTAIEWDAGEIRIDCAGAPPLPAIEGTWGYTPGAPEDLGLVVPDGTRVTSEPIAFASGVDPLDALEADAAATGTAMGARHWSGAPILGWESWYHFGLTVSPEDILRNASVLGAIVADPRFDLVQIDDGWQRCYGGWWANERWPEDMGEIVRALADRGLRAGLWLAPFMVVPEAPGLGTEHPEWCIGDPTTGAPRREPRHDRWALDASNPAVVGFLRDLGAQVRSWGFEMVKLDFLYFAAQTGTRHDPTVTGTEALRRGLAAFVDGFGDDRYVLGCGMPLLPAVGRCHGNRIGHDTAMPRVHMEFGHPAQDWTGYLGVLAQARNVAARSSLHRRWFDCDPDVVMAWGSDGADPAGYSPDEARMLATLAALCGGPCFVADDLPALTGTDRTALAEPGFASNCWGGHLRVLDLFEHPDDCAVEEAFSRPTDLAREWRTRRDGRDMTVTFDWEARRIR